MKSVLAIDEGTTGSTCLVIAEDGRVLGRGYREITQHFPQPGWVEHDADEIYERTLEAAREAISQAKVTPTAVGITNQRETIVVWSRKTHKPLGRAIVWQDRRTADRCRELASDTDEIRRLTGLVIDPYFSATKLEWILRHRVKGEDTAELCAGTIDSWLIWKLTGGAVHAPDPTNASRTMLYDIDAAEWSEALCARFGVPVAMLPEVRPSSGDFGVVSAGILGNESIPIAGVAGDQQAALFGQGCWSAGTGKNTYGTGAFLLLNAGAARPKAEGGLLCTVACDSAGGPVFALEASIFIAGAAIQWLRDGLQIIEQAPDSAAIAASLESNEGVYFVPALTGLGAPHWEAGARGTIVGLTRGTTRAHLIRAALEAMAYATRDVIDLMRASAAATFGILRVDGGASGNDWLMQFQADVLGVPVERPDMVETTALGAAGLAGLSAGVWPDAESFLAAREFARFEPGDGSVAAQEALGGWRRAVNTSLHWARSEP
jgi:glycerol kinase